MIYTDLTRKAMCLCYARHHGQLDKSGVPYVFHPFHVAESMKDEATTCVALLHDIVEDTDTTLEELLEMGFPKDVVEAVGLLTHDKALSYQEYILRIRVNPLARAVKLSDLQHNSDATRLLQITERDEKRLEKYRKAIEILQSAE